MHQLRNSASTWVFSHQWAGCKNVGALHGCGDDTREFLTAAEVVEEDALNSGAQPP